MRKIIQIIAASLSVAAFAVVPASAATASTGHGAMIIRDHTTPRIPGPCDQGTVHNAIGLGSGGYLGVWWNPDSDSSTTDGCAALWAQVRDFSGHTTTGGKVYYDNGIHSVARTQDGGALRWAKAWMFINGACQYKVFYSQTGTTGWTRATCPASRTAHLVLTAHRGTGPVPPCWRATYHATSGSPAIHIVFCLPGKRPAGSRELDITNDGSDAGRIDRGDVLISGWYPPPSR